MPEQQTAWGVWLKLGMPLTSLFGSPIGRLINQIIHQQKWSSWWILEKHKRRVILPITLLWSAARLNLRILGGDSTYFFHRRPSSLDDGGISGLFSSGGPSVRSHEVRRRGQWASRGVPGKSGLHASGQGERVIAPERFAIRDWTELIPSGVWDLRSLTRDGTLAPCIGSVT